MCSYVFALFGGCLVWCGQHSACFVFSKCALHGACVLLVWYAWFVWPAWLVHAVFSLHCNPIFEVVASVSVLSQKKADCVVVLVREYLAVPPSRLHLVHP